MTFPPPFTYRATVLRVIDGDTIEVDVDLGMFLHHTPTPVRLLGLNCRELSEPGGPEAQAYVSGLLAPGTVVMLQTTAPDKFAPRWDATVSYIGPDGMVHDLGRDLIAQGWAAAWNGRGPRPVPPWPITTT